METIYRITDIVWMAVIALGAVVYVWDRLKKKKY